VAPLADVSIASTFADGVLMIVRAGVTPKPAIERALSGLDVSKVLGLVLNDAGDGAGVRYGYAGGYVAG
jgi:Mrp family chromosome partitioning ATPase